MEKITADNWTFTGYRSESLTAIISLGAAPPSDESGNIEMIYYMSVIDPEGHDLYQEELASLADAITKINLKYGHWQFIDRQGKTGGSGCDSCAAH